MSGQTVPSLDAVLHTLLLSKIKVRISRAVGGVMGERNEISTPLLSLVPFEISIIRLRKRGVGENYEPWRTAEREVVSV